MPHSPIYNLLENSNGRQRRAAALCLLVVCVIVAIGWFVRPEKVSVVNTAISTSNELRVAFHDPLFPRFDTPGTPGHLNTLLIKAFAEHTDRELTLLPVNDYATAVQGLRDGQVELVLSNKLESQVYPFPAIKSVATTDTSLLLIGLQGPWPAPSSLSDLENKTVAAIAGSGVDDVMKAHQTRWPNIELITVQDRASPELMEMVTSTQVQYAVVQSNEFLMMQHVFPDLINRYELDGRYSTGWLVSTHDPLFAQTVEQFVRDIKASGQMHSLQESNQRHLWDFNFAEASLFLQRVDDILPRFETEFRKAEGATSVDWRLLAAIAHQESHWNPQATSPTGVRGMMMLTRTTADDLGVSDRLSVTESIHGGARYFQQLYNRLPNDIPKTDRNSIALAAYNLGPGHVLRAQQLAASAGVDPYDWEQLRTFIRLLEEDPDPVKLAQATRPETISNATAQQGAAAENKPVVTATLVTNPEGLANTEASEPRPTEPLDGRALEALRYVDNVRRYHDILIWITEQNQQSEKSLPATALE